MVAFAKDAFKCIENGTDDIRVDKVWVLGGWDPYNKLRMNQESTEAKALKSVEIFDPSLASPPSSSSSPILYTLLTSDRRADGRVAPTWSIAAHSIRPPVPAPAPRTASRPAAGRPLRRSSRRTSAAGRAVRVLRGRPAG